jgi:hypothetical protein
MDKGADIHENDQSVNDAGNRVSTEVFFLLSTKSEFRFRLRFRYFTFGEIIRRNVIQISSSFRCRNRSFDLVSISTSEFRFWCRFRHWNFDFVIGIPISVLVSTFQTNFRRNKSKCLQYFNRLLSIIKNNNFIESRNYFDRNSDRNFDENDLCGNPSRKVCDCGAWRGLGHSWRASRYKICVKLNQYLYNRRSLHLTTFNFLNNKKKSI